MEQSWKEKAWKTFSCASENLESFLHNMGRQISFWASDRARKKKIGAQNQIAGPIETQLETLLFALYYLNSTYNHHF